MSTISVVLIVVVVLQFIQCVILTGRITRMEEKVKEQAETITALNAAKDMIVESIHRLDDILDKWERKMQHGNHDRPQ
jgi:uncharacterized coiled-coil protein SlyX